VVLPSAVYAELLRLAAPVMMGAFVTYTIMTSDYMPLAFVVTLPTVVVGIQVVTDPKVRFHRNLLWLAPAAWLLFYAVDMVEFQALVRSLRRLATGKDLKWQKWVRIGVLNNACLGSPNGVPVLD
jgi:hypothetical protein